MIVIFLPRLDRAAGGHWYLAGVMALASTGAVLARGEAVRVLRDTGGFAGHKEWLAWQDRAAQSRSAVRLHAKVTRRESAI